MANSAVTLTGNVTRDPELKYTNSGKAVVSFGLAVNRRYQVNGEWQEQVSFFNVTAWDQLGENVAASLTKGARVVVSGRIEVREYDKRDGGKGVSVDVTADEIGASLRWATVQVERNPRDGAAGGSSAGSEIAGAFAPSDSTNPF